MITPKEGSSFDLTVSFYSPNGTAETPTGITWQVFDKVSKTAMNTVQTVSTPAAQINLTMPASVNAIVNEGSASEVRVLVVTASFTDGSWVETYEWTLLHIL